jgi:oligoendopeptidase F
MKSENAHLRTRISEKGMDYKGYNIAVHEFGHNVEQTISLHNVDYYMINGVPNTAFTEALAFIFQKRDLFLLGIKDENPDKVYLETLDAYWSVFEIMGVSMVDMKVWKWLYENPEATAEELNAATVRIAKEVWNKYFAEVFGSKDEPILAIYSHMINSPLYLANYSFGHLIDFQIEQYLVGKNFSTEVDRMWRIGRLTPQVWMQKAVGENISAEPMIIATKEALQHIQ